MKKILPVLCCVLLGFTSCKETDAPSPLNLNGLWEGSYTLSKNAGESCEAEIKTDQLRMIWRVDFRDTVTVTEQQYSDFSKRWFNLPATWRGSVISDSVVRITKYYESNCLLTSNPDSVVFRGTVRLQQGFLVLNLEGEEKRCSDTVSEPEVCTYSSSYQIRKRAEE